jgi:septation ring formation regulator EzrA
MDSTYDIAETTGENVSQIGNALKKAGAVRENAYKLMPTDFRSTSRVQRRLEKLGNAADTIEQISSDALDVTQEVKEMKSNQKEFNDELEKAITEQSKVDDSKKKDAISNPEHKPEDEIRTLPKEG